LFNIIKYLFKS